MPTAALVVAFSAALTALTLAAPATAQQPASGPPTTIDGPGPDVLRPSGLEMAIARDGGGGLVYVKQVAGVAHVFVSQLAGGTFQAPVQIDSGLAAPSSQPVIAAANGGLLLIAFINGGELYVVQAGSGGKFGPPAGLAAGAINPAISMTNLGKAYIAFAVADGAGYDVRTAYYVNQKWALEAPPLNIAAADDAGTGARRPAVAAAGDGVAIVVWGESGHVYSRRVWRTTPSVVAEQADASPAGCLEAGADTPGVGAGGDSSFAPVVFRETVTCGGHQQSRVLMNRLHASVYDGILSADGLSGAPADGAGSPQLAVTEYGRGWVTAARTLSHSAMATGLMDNGWPISTNQVNGGPEAGAPYPMPATAGLYSTLVAWQQEPGSAGPAEIRVRYAADGSRLGPEMVVSSPAQGPADAADGIAAAGDVSGDGAVAWLQGTAGATAVVVGQLYQPPSSFVPLTPFAYSNTSQPLLAWKRPRGWGPLKYSLTVDGGQVALTYANAAQPSAPLPDGPHSWQVVASNPGGQQSQSRSAAVFIDTVAPVAVIHLVGSRAVGSRLRATVNYADRPPAGEPRSDASGLANVSVRWGDGTVTRLRRGAHHTVHAYRRAGRYQILAVISDRAGNVTRVATIVRVAKSVQTGRPAKPGNRRRSTRGSTPTTGGSKPAADVPKPTTTAGQ
jgi:hypothetical protein